MRVLPLLQLGDLLVAVLHLEMLIAADEMIDLVPRDGGRRSEQLVQRRAPRDRVAVRQRLVVDGPEDLGQRQEVPREVGDVPADECQDPVARSLEPLPHQRLHDPGVPEGRSRPGLDLRDGHGQSVAERLVPPGLFDEGPREVLADPVIDVDAQDHGLRGSEVDRLTGRMAGEAGSRAAGAEDGQNARREQADGTGHGCLLAEGVPPGRASWPASSSVARLPGLVPGPWFCAPASWLVCLRRKEVFLPAPGARTVPFATVDTTVCRRYQ